MSKQSFNLCEKDEISFKYIIDFLAESWKLILVTGLLGFLASGVYLIVAPNQYQAIAYIQMAQISDNNSSANPRGFNIEDPHSLIVRLKSPTAYSDEVIKACAFENTVSPAESLVDRAKLSVVKGVTSMIQLKINRDSRELAFSCAHALFESIKTSQEQIIKPYIEESKALLVKYEARLVKSQSLVSAADKSGYALSAAYLANRDEVKFLTEEILRLNSFITNANARQTKLVSPIYVANDPIFPRKTINLIVGLIVGLFMGFLFAMGKKSLKT